MDGKQAKEFGDRVAAECFLAAYRVLLPGVDRELIDIPDLADRVIAAAVKVSKIVTRREAEWDDDTAVSAPFPVWDEMWIVASALAAAGNGEMTDDEIAECAPYSVAATPTIAFSLAVEYLHKFDDAVSALISLRDGDIDGPSRPISAARLAKLIGHSEVIE